VFHVGIYLIVLIPGVLVAVIWHGVKRWQHLRDVEKLQRALALFDNYGFPLDYIPTWDKHGNKVLVKREQ
jgi:hypothetical protein